MQRASRQRSAHTRVQPEQSVAAKVESRIPSLTEGLTATRRIIAVLVVAAILIFSYASSLRVWVAQERQLAETRQQIAARTQHIGDLQDELRRWQDSAYVKAQARVRLGWVLPGETGYRVVDANGQPLGGGAQIDREGALPGDEHRSTWWERMWGTVRTADDPVPAANTRTITPP